MTATTQQAGWVRALSAETAADALAAARDVANRLRDPEAPKAATTAALEQSKYPEYIRWAPHDLAQGDIGLAVLFGQLDACFPGSGWDAEAHRCLASGARATEWIPHLPPGLFGGLGGVAFAARMLSREGTRYRRLLAELDRGLLPQAERGAEHLRHATGCSVGAFDVISGLSGTGAYLLLGQKDPAVQSTLRKVLGALVALCGEQAGVPNWHTPYESMGPGNVMAWSFPNGNLNCGLAHGVPGPLALLSLAMAEGVVVPGQREAVAHVARWLTDHRADDEWGVNWPSAVALPDEAGTVQPPEPARNAWCYGSPGVARALWLAGSALGDDELRGLAVEAMAATYRRPVPRRSIDGPNLCHGVAGLLQVTLRFAADTGDPVFTRAAEDLTGQLLGMYDRDSLLGFRDIEPEGQLVDQPGLLSGAPGVALALLAAGADVPPAWDRLFLLS
ncbi:lanthionine synthetase C family protein [Streptodolium elevatio]|uniref:Lanthionine synthetase C family protein n=1 Tax=Streptodolium elevatio TaxID=3157996 RepID=A0ABV3DSC9_9ACTN